MTSWDELKSSLKGLSLEEQEAIRCVLEKDLEFQQMEQNRIRSLSTSIQNKKSSIEKRRESSVAGSESSESGLSSPGNISHGRSSPLPKWNNKFCSICTSTLGYILNSGTKCKKCQIALCEKCASVVQSGNNTKYDLCPICYSERELSAAKNEWVKGSDEMTSEKLLSAMRIAEKRCSFQIGSSQTQNIPSNSRSGRAPYKRNLTLPAIQTNFLSVPDEEKGIIQSAAATCTTQKFWGGSPSPRSPKPLPSENSSMNNIYESNMSSENLRAIHPREPIGSPAPRPMSSSPLSNVPEDDFRQDTIISVPPVERRRSAYEGSRREPRKFLEALTQFDRNKNILFFHILTIRTERKFQMIHDEFFHFEIEFRRKSSKTIMRHKSHKRRTNGENVEKINEIFKFPRILEKSLYDSILTISCVVSFLNQNQKMFEGKIQLNELATMRNGIKQLKIIELRNISIYSIEEEEDSEFGENYDWIISV